MIYTNINVNMYKQYHTSYIYIYMYMIPYFEYNQCQHWTVTMTMHGHIHAILLYKKVKKRSKHQERSDPSPATPAIQSGRVSAPMVLRIHGRQRHPQNIQILKMIQPWNQTSQKSMYATWMRWMSKIYIDRKKKTHVVTCPNKKCVVKNSIEKLYVQLLE